MLQTKVTVKNQTQFYQRLYCQQSDDKQQLVDLDLFANQCIIIDCCGWHYQNLFPNKNILILETVNTALQFKLDRNKFTKLIDDRQDHQIVWPDLTTTDPVLVFDRSPIMKYRSIANLTSLLSDAVAKYNASQLVVNLQTTFIDDSRLVDRFYNLSSISIPNFTVTRFMYSADISKLFVHLKRNYVQK